MKTESDKIGEVEYRLSLANSAVHSLIDYIDAQLEYDENYTPDHNLEGLLEPLHDKMREVNDAYTARIFKFT